MHVQHVCSYCDNRIETRNTVIIWLSEVVVSMGMLPIVLVALWMHGSRYLWVSSIIDVWGYIIVDWLYSTSTQRVVGPFWVCMHDGSATKSYANSLINNNRHAKLHTYFSLLLSPPSSSQPPSLCFHQAVCCSTFATVRNWQRRTKWCWTWVFRSAPPWRVSRSTASFTEIWWIES